MDDLRELEPAQGLAGTSFQFQAPPHCQDLPKAWEPPSQPLLGQDLESGWEIPGEGGVGVLESQGQ